MDPDVRTSKYVASLSLLGLGVTLVYLLQRGFAFFVRGYLDYLTMPEYTYLMVLVPISVTLAITVIVRWFHPSTPSIPNLMSSTVLLLSALLFFVLGGLDEVNAAQLYGASFVLAALSLLLLVFRVPTIRHFIGVFLLLLIAVPVPVSFISYSSTFFSYLIGRFVAAVMGAEVIESGSRFFISVYDAEGVRRVFELVHACSGVVSVTSVLAISPLIVYMVMRSHGSIAKGVAKALAIIGAAVAIVFAGNAARVAAVLYYTRHHGYEQALEIFHQYPSFIYSVLAVIAAFYLLGKLAPPAPEAAARVRDHLPHLRGAGLRFSAITLAVASVLALGFASITPALSLPPGTAGPQSIPTLDTLISETAEVLFNGTGAEVLDERPVPALRVILGSSSVNSIVLRYNGTTYSGYAEVAESPTRFHGWHVCLTFQGYTILRSWRDVAGDLIINYLLVSKGGEERLLAYATYEVPFLLSNGTATAYVRISLFANVKGEESVGAAAQVLKQLLELPLGSEGGGGGAAAIGRIVLLQNLLLLASAVAASGFVIDAIVRALGLRH